MTISKTLLITGANSGFGRAFYEAGVGAGHTVVGTVRRDEDRAALENMSTEGRAKMVLLDVTDFNVIDRTVRSIEQGIAPIDVLINSARRAGICG